MNNVDSDIGRTLFTDNIDKWNKEKRNPVHKRLEKFLTVNHCAFLEISSLLFTFRGFRKFKIPQKSLHQLLSMAILSLDIGFLFWNRHESPPHSKIRYFSHYFRKHHAYAKRAVKSIWTNQKSISHCWRHYYTRNDWMIFRLECNWLGNTEPHARRTRSMRFVCHKNIHCEFDFNVESNNVKLSEVKPFSWTFGGYF